MSDDEGRLVAGRYRLQSRVGSGAMGIVWRAFDDRLDRTVAVKQLVLPPGLNEAEAGRARERAFREGRIAARLQHPNAISVYNVAEDDGDPVLVMEYLPARSLDDVLAERGVLPPAEVARIGAQVASALAAAHAAGVIHRDVKPANILLGEDGTTKITDFGISRAVGDVTVTSTGLLAGTPAFLSPETARGHEPGPASDVFSLGATLYAAVEGRPPFGNNTNEIALLHAVASGQVIPPRQAGPLTAPLTALLQADPAARPTMAQAIPTLQAVSEGRVAADAPTVPAAPRPSGTRLDMHPAATASTYAPSPVAAAPATAAGPWRGRGPRVAVMAFAVLMAAAVGVLVAELLASAGERDTPGQASPTSAVPSPTPESSAPPSPTPTPDEVTPADLEDAVEEYYDLLPDDTDEAWDRLGPGLREQGKRSYVKFWDSVKDVDVRGSPAALDDDTVEVQLDFKVDGGKVTREVHHLGMITRDGEPKINSDEVMISREIKGDKKDDKDNKDDKDDKDEDDDDN